MTWCVNIVELINSYLFTIRFEDMLRSSKTITMTQMQRRWHHHMTRIKKQQLSTSAARTVPTDFISPV